MKNYYSKEFKISILEEYKATELTIDEFAESKGIKSTTFQKWLYSMPKEVNTGFVEVKLPAVIPAERMIRIRKAGLEIQIPSELEEPELTKILRSVAAV